MPACAHTRPTRHSDLCCSKQSGAPTCTQAAPQLVPQKRALDARTSRSPTGDTASACAPSMRARAAPHLCSVGKVPKLRLPQDEAVWVLHAVTQLKAQNAELGQRAGRVREQARERGKEVVWCMCVYVQSLHSNLQATIGMCSIQLTERSRKTWSASIPALVMPLMHGQHLMLTTQASAPSHLCVKHLTPRPCLPPSPAAFACCPHPAAHTQPPSPVAHGELAGALAGEHIRKWHIARAILLVVHQRVPANGSVHRAVGLSMLRAAQTSLCSVRDQAGLGAAQQREHGSCMAA